MYKICKTAASGERQKQFDQTLFDMMKTQLFKDITVTALCKEINAPRKAFYRYFDTLEDVLKYLWAHIFIYIFKIFIVQ